MGELSHSGWPIVVGGCHRSGTSLVRRILDSHSRIHCGPEVKFFAELYGEFRVGWPMVRYIPTASTLLGDEDLFDVLAPGFIALHERAARVAGKERWADKAPENVLHLARWQRLLGDRWRFVHVVRNPLDTIASIREARFPDVPTDLTAQAIHYRRYFEGGWQFASAHPERSHLVVYEQLVAAPSETVATLMGSLDERLEPGQLAFNSEPHQPGVEDFKVYGTTEVHPLSVNRWTTVLSKSEAALVWDLTGDLWDLVDPDGRLAPVLDDERAHG